MEGNESVMAFDASAFLEYFGFERIKNHDEENMMASCFQWEMHTNDDRKRSFGIRKDTGVANCYVCGGWSLEQLTKELLNRRAEALGEDKRYNDFDALKFLEEKGWLPEEESIDDLKRQFDNMESIEFVDVVDQFKPKKKEKKVEYMTQRDLDPYLTSMHKRTLQRGETKNAIDVDTARFFQLGYDKQTKRIIIPVRDEFNRIVGVVSRATQDDEFIRYGIGTINPDWQLARYQNKPFDGEKMLWVFDKRDYVYGEHLWYKVNEDGERVLKHDKILVLESPLDVVYAYAQGLGDFFNLGAIFGSKVTKQQMAKILRHPCVIEALDNDKGGKEGREHFHKNAEGKCDLYTCDSWGKKDLGDCTPEEVQDLPSRITKHENSIFADLEIQLD